MSTAPTWRPTLLAVALSATASGAHGVWNSQYLGEWAINGSNTLRAETYSNGGDETQSPYRFEGGQFYDEFNVNFSRRVSRYENLYGHIAGVWNESEYRAADDGIVPERLSLRWEKGDAGIPFRAELGDYYGYLSYRTLQRSLKGVQLDLQPVSSAPRRKHSIIVLAGADQPFWRHIDADEDTYLAASWLMEDAVLGRWAVNAVHNSRSDFSTGGGNTDIEQWVTTIAGEREFRYGQHRVTLEGEIGRLSGEHAGNPNDSESGSGVFFEARGRSWRKLSYRLRHENYDDNYRPHGAVISADRRTHEAHLGWRFDSGLRLRGRWQRWRDFDDSVNPQDTRTVGVQLSGPFGGGFSGSVHGFRQDVDTRNLSIDRRTDTLQADVSRALPGGWTGRASVFLQDIDDRTAGGGDRDTRQFSLRATHAFRAAGFSGSITPGVLYREIDADSGDSDDWHPTLDLRASRGRHDIGFNYGYLSQDRDASGKLVTQQAALRYQYRLPKDTFGVEANLFDRDNDGGADTDAYRISVFWTHRFDKPAHGRAKSGTVASSLAGGGTLPTDARLLAAIRPGDRVEKTDERLSEAGIRDGLDLVDTRVYETVALGSIDQRQRLALELNGPVVKRAGLVIDFDSLGSADSAAQLFERVREILIDAYGRPSRTVEEGEFGADFAADVNASRLLRLVEWHFVDGVIRFGIPRRLDGEVRMEVQHARDLPPFTETLWSLDGVP